MNTPPSPFPIVLLGGAQDGMLLNPEMREAPAFIQIKDPHTGAVLTYVPSEEKAADGRAVYRFNPGPMNQTVPS
jgi:hypothetical protein